MSYTSHHKVAKGLLPATSLQPREVFFYFYDLRDRGFELEEFKVNWKQISKSDFDIKALVTILNKTSKYANASSSSDVKNSIKDFLTKDGAIFSIRDLLFDKIPECNALQLSSILSSFAHLDLRPDEEFMKAWGEKAKEKIQSFDTFGLSNVIWSLATLSISPEKKLRNLLLRNIQEKLPTAKMIDKSACLWSLSVLSVLDDCPVYVRTARRIFASLENDPGIQSMNNRDKSQIDVAAKWFGHESFLQSGIKTMDYKSAWEINLRRHFKNSPFSRNNICDPYLPALGREADVHLSVAGKNIFIEADGPTHFVTDFSGEEYFLNGSTLLRNAMIAKAYPESVIVSFRYIDAQRPFDERNAHKLIGILTDKFQAMASGIYQSRTAGPEFDLIPTGNNPSPD